MDEVRVLNRIDEFAHFLTSETNSVLEIGQHLVEKTLENFDLIACYFLRADRDGKLRFVGGYNVPDEATRDLEPLDLSEKLPATECVRNLDLIWLNEDEWRNSYPRMNDFYLDPNLNTIINVPLKVKNHPIACLGLISKSHLDKADESRTFLSTVSSLTGLGISNFKDFKVAKPDGVSRQILTRRQNKILDLLREKLTNKEIGDELGFSESTIRQETMRIYEVLKVENRKQAANFKFIED